MSRGNSICPRCGAAAMKSWDELDRDEKIAIKSQPKSADFTPEERKKHCFCTRCLFEEIDADKHTA